MSDRGGGEGDDSNSWRIGELASQTGLTVRALHHFDQIGLLVPSLRTPAGHRRYTPTDVAGLYRIVLLRRLGLPLEQIRVVLSDPGWQLADAMRRHLGETRRRATVEARLAARLTEMVDAIGTDRGLTTDQLFETMEDMMILDNAVHGTTSILVYDDLTAASSYLCRVFGLVPGPIQVDGDGRAVHAELRAGNHAIWLHPAGDEYRSPKQAGIVTSMTVINVDDVDAHYARTVSQGGEIVEKPVDQGYGVREYGARDLEGHLWFFHAPLNV
jgi:MerR family transcriptional regulator, thiopeptide resistance regulator